jgi:hypothetical protein
VLFTFTNSTVNGNAGAYLLMKGFSKHVEALYTRQYPRACGTAAPDLHTASGTGVQQHAEANEFCHGSL